MIERETQIWIASEALGYILSPQNPAAARRFSGRLVRTSSEGFYEVTVDLQGKSYTALLPIAGTAIMAASPEPEVTPIEVER
jgi:hypothetical protein